MLDLGSSNFLGPCAEVSCCVWGRDRVLLRRNPDNYHYHEGLRAAKRLSPDASGAWTAQQRAELTMLYDTLAETNPRSSAAQRIPLDFKVSAACGEVELGTSIKPSTS